MRKAAAIVLGFLAIVSTGRAGADARPGGGGAAATPNLPGALDAFYPPKADGPLYLFRMLAVDTPFSGIVVDLMEDDIEGARGSFAEFRRAYREAAGMVAEWSGMFPEEPVEDLGAALAAGDKGRAMNAHAAVGAICHRCHVATMVPVQQKFRWGNMGALTVKDPVSGVATAYAQFKRSLAANLAGITVDLEQRQADNARTQFDGFKARFRALSESCGSCHEEKRRSYVDQDAQDAVDAIGRAFAAGAPDPKTVASLVRKIGRESCSGCHLVHVPAAIAGASPKRPLAHGDERGPVND